MKTNNSEIFKKLVESIDSTVYMKRRSDVNIRELLDNNVYFSKLQESDNGEFIDDKIEKIARESIEATFPYVIYNDIIDKTLDVLDKKDVYYIITSYFDNYDKLVFKHFNYVGVLKSYIDEIVDRVLNEFYQM